LQSDPRHSNSYFNLSNGEKDFKGSWNEGKSPEFGEKWKYIADPAEHIHDSNGLLDEKAQGTDRTEDSVQKKNKQLSEKRKKEIEKATAPTDGVMSWSIYAEEVEAEKRNMKGK
jgi:Mn-containing catalase